MGEYAVYRAVRSDDLTAALADTEPKNALFELAFGSDATGPQVDLANAHEPLAFVLARPDGDYMDFDDLLVSAVLGHRQIGTDAPSVNDPERVRAISSALAVVDREALRRNFDAETMDDEGVEPGGFSADPGWIDTIVEAFDTLREFYADAAADGRAVVVDIG